MGDGRFYDRKFLSRFPSKPIRLRDGTLHPAVRADASAETQTTWLSESVSRFVLLGPIDPPGDTKAVVAYFLSWFVAFCGANRVFGC